MGIRRSGQRTRRKVVRRSAPSGPSAYSKALAKKAAKAKAPPPPPRSVSKAAMDAKRRSEGLSRANASRDARRRSAANQKFAQSVKSLPPAQQATAWKSRGVAEKAAKDAAKKQAVINAQAAYDRAFKKESIRFAEGLKAQAAWARKTSQTTAQSRAIQQTEARALGTLTGTAQKGTPLVIGSAYATQQKAAKATAQKKQQEITKKAGVAYSLVIPETLSLKDSLSGVKTSPDIVTTSAPKPVVAGIGAPLSRTVSVPLMAGGSFEVKRPTKEVQGPKEKPTPVIDFLTGAAASVRALGAMAVQTVLQPAPLTAYTSLALSKLGITDVPLKAVKKRLEFSQEVAEKIAPDPTLLGSTVEQAIKGEPLTGTGRGLWYDVGSAAADIALIAAPLKKIPLPKIQTVAPSGQKLATTLSVGIGTKSKIVLTKVVGQKTVFGTPKSYAPGSIKIEPITAKEIKRGVKLAADSSQVQQQLLTDIAAIKAVKGITPKAIAKAENISAIIKLGSKSKDPVQPKFKFAKQAFKDISETEQPSLFKSFKTQQKIVRQPLGPFEGSLSQQPFVLPKYQVKAGDFDFNVATFKSAETKAVRISKDIVADPGRTFKPAISEKLQSAKVELTTAKGEKIKVGELLNPKEKSPEGLEQVITGETLFGRTIPKGTVKVEGMKVYGLQRQFLKKGESLMTLQKVVKKDPFGKKAETIEFELAPYKPREFKEVSHFYGIAKTKQANLIKQGKIIEAEMLGKELATFKRLNPKVEIDKFYKMKGIQTETEVTTFGKGESLYTKVVEGDALPTAAVVSGIRGAPAIRKPTTKPITTKQPNTITKIIGKDKPTITTKAKPKLDTTTSYAKLTTSSKPLTTQSRTLPYLSGYAKPPKISYRPSVSGKSPYTGSIVRTGKVKTPSSSTSIISKTIKGKPSTSLISKPFTKPLKVKSPSTSSITGSKSTSLTGKGLPSKMSSLVSSPPKGSSSLPSRGSTPFRFTTPSRTSVPSRPSTPSTPSIGYPSRPTSPPSTPSIGYPRSPPSPGIPRSPGSPPTGRPPRAPPVSRFSALGIAATTTFQERRRLPKAIPFWQRSRKPIPKYRPVKPGADYIGNVPVDKIVGVYGRSTTIYGKIKTAKLEEADIYSTKRKYKSITSRKGRGLLGGPTVTPTGTKVVLHL